MNICFAKMFTYFCAAFLRLFLHRSRSTMDSIRVSEALDSGSIPDETTSNILLLLTERTEIAAEYFYRNSN